MILALIGGASSLFPCGSVLWVCVLGGSSVYVGRPFPICPCVAVLPTLTHTIEEPTFCLPAMLLNHRWGATFLPQSLPLSGPTFGWCRCARVVHYLCTVLHCRVTYGDVWRQSSGICGYRVSKKRARSPESLRMATLCKRLAVLGRKKRGWVAPQWGRFVHGGLFSVGWCR